MRWYMVRLLFRTYCNGQPYDLAEDSLRLIRAKTLKRVLSAFSPTFPGFYLYYPSRRQQSSKLKAFVDYAMTRRAGRRLPGRMGMRRESLRQ